MISKGGFGIKNHYLFILGFLFMYLVCALYHFILLEDLKNLQTNLLQKMKENAIFGSLLIAKEGINGTISATPSNMASFMAYLRLDPRFKNLQAKESYHSTIPFERTKVKIKKEIVTMGVENIDPSQHAGTYIKPENWNDTLLDPKIKIIDARNKYEVSIGTFLNATDPKTDTFREFPDFVSKNLGALAKDQKIAMFCTGGIRCEKATAYLKQQGFTQVYHLEGGILKYLEEVPESQSLWKGECFVFDERVSVNHNLEKGHYDQCYACRMPITQEDKKHPSYLKGISCHYCLGSKDNQQLNRYAEREKQIHLAQQRGQKHIGGIMPEIIKQNREKKHETKNK